MPAPSLVGRDAELAQVQHALAQVVSGSPCAVLVTGPTGIGKTRLAQEARDLAAATGLATFESRAHELSKEVAYAPVVAAFAPMLDRLEPAARAELVGDLPQLRRVFSGLSGSSPQVDEPDLLRIGVLDALTRMVDRLARQRPLMWSLDDVHAADAETRLLVLHLAAALPDRPLLLLLASRDDEPAGDHLHQLGKALSEASWQVYRLALSPLDDVAATQLAEGVLGQPLGPDLAGAVVARSVGRPLFVESLAQHLREDDLVSSRDGVLTRSEVALPFPDALAPTLRGRLSGLGPDEPTVLETLAVAGAPLETAMLSTVTGLPHERLEAALRRVERRRLAISVAAAWDIAHGLLRDAVLTDLPAATIASVHARLSAALLAEAPDDPRLGEHVLRAGAVVAPEIAVPALTTAAQRARRVGAPADARRYLSRAVQLDRSTDLVSELGEVCEQLGDLSAARELWQEALTAYDAQQRPVEVARTRRMLGLLEWSNNDIAAADDQFAQAQAALDGLEPGPELGELLHVQMVTANRIGDLAALELTGRRLQELAERLGSPALAVRAHLASAISACGRTDFTAMNELNARALDASAELDSQADAALVLRVHDQISVGAGVVCDLTTLRRHSLESLRIAQESGNPTWEPWPRARLAFVDFLCGDLDSALRGSAEVLGFADRHHQPRGTISACAGHAMMLVHRGRLTEARSLLERGRALVGTAMHADRNIFSPVALAGTWLGLAEGDPEAACRAGASLADMAGGWIPLLTAAVYAEACIAAGDDAGMEGVIDRLKGIVACQSELPDRLADWLEGLRALRDGRMENAAPLLVEARSGFHRLGLATHAAWARLRAAQALRETDADTATTYADEALTFFESMGSPQPAQQARELLRSLGVTPSRGRARSRGDGPLSARELEVARLVAAGLTNAEVATELFISPRTVSTHLDRMYARLGVSSRVALTRYLADSGLLDDVT
ncbi:MAG TPA: AAA family ATPase [Nocardioidaceae bacterium]|nr:AAA family ATPase [Nocardioidaceae bacterium]